MEENSKGREEKKRELKNDIEDYGEPEVERLRSEKSARSVKTARRQVKHIPHPADKPKRSETKATEVPKVPYDAKIKEELQNAVVVSEPFVKNEEGYQNSGLPEKKGKATEEEREAQKERKNTEKPKKPKKVRNVKLICATAASFCFVIGLFIFAAVIGGGQSREEQAAGEGVTEALTDAETVEDIESWESAQVNEAAELTASEIYSKCIEGVVSVSVSREGGQGIGSGFFITSDGYIATAAHVVEDSESVRVILHSGREYEARVEASNSFSDIALLKISGEGFECLSFGDSSALEVGERVSAIGTPASLEYAGSLSSGEVSYNNRSVKIYDDSGELLKKMTLIQTNAQVNPGNSGCPLFNKRGEVVGMVTMKLSKNYAGIGFALPSNGVKAILDVMMAGEEPSYETLAPVATPIPKIGITAAEYKGEDVEGLEVKGFSNSECSASRILKVGDIITELGDTRIKSMAQWAEIINKYDPGDRLSVTVFRSGQHLTFSVTLY